MNNEDRKYCVYMHKNKINGKVYIGQTGTSVNDRWQNGKGYKGCILFERAINKYGWDNFDHIIMADNLTQVESSQIERDLIASYDSTNPENGYNVSIGGESGHVGVKMSDESREKMSKARKGKRFSQDHKNKISAALKGRKISDEAINKARITRSEPFVQLDLDGNLIQEYLTTWEAKQTTGISQDAISSVLNKNDEQKTAGGFIWMHSFEYYNLVEKDVKYINLHLSPVIQLSKNGEYISEFKSCAEAQRAIGRPGGKTINACCRGDAKSAYGFIWVYKNEYDETKDYSFKREPHGNQYSVVQIDCLGNLVEEFDSVQKAHLTTGINYCCICECCNGTQKTAGGFRWMRRLDWDKLQPTIQNELEEVI